MPDDLTIEQAVERWDEFAQSFLQLNPTIRFSTAQSPDERKAVFRARYVEVTQNGWAQPEDLPDGIERDEYDDDALHLIGWEGDRMMIIGRLVFPAPNRPLPTEATFNIKFEPAQQVVDTGRGILVDGHLSDAKHKLFLGLMGFAWQQSRSHGYYHGCAAMTASMLRLYRMMHMHWDVLGEPHFYWGEWRYPCKYNLVKTIQALRNRET